jgi:hypothetical protein
MTEASPPRPARRRSRLVLRRPADIAWAFVLGPTAGLTVLFLLMLISFMIGGAPLAVRLARTSLAFFFVYLLIFGGIVCLVVELVFITPLLMGFHRYRWGWLNGWTGALIGFAFGFLPALLVLTLAPQTASGPRIWLARIIAAAAVGAVGAIAAGVFRLLAVRRAEDSEEVSS